MANFYKDNDDLRFYLERGIDWAPLVELTERGFRTPDGPKSVAEAVAFYREIAEMVGEFVGRGDRAARRRRSIARALALEDGEAVLPPAAERASSSRIARARPARAVPAARARRHERARCSSTSSPPSCSPAPTSR